MTRANIGPIDPMQFAYERLHTDEAFDGYAPRSGVKDPELDKLFDEFGAELEKKKRKAIFKKIMLRNNEKAYIIPYWQGIFANVWSDKVKNFRPMNYAAWGERGFQEVWKET